MPRTLINPSPSSMTGSSVSFVAADSVNGMEFNNSEVEKLIVKNDSASSITVTIKSVPCSHGRTKDEVITVPATTQRVIGTFDKHLYNNKGKVEVNFSASASVTVALIS